MHRSIPFTHQPRLSNSDTAPTIPLNESPSTSYGLFLVDYDQPLAVSSTPVQKIDIIYRNYDQDGVWRFVISGVPFNQNHIINSIAPIPIIQDISHGLAIEIQKEVRQQMNDLAQGFEVMTKVNNSAEENKRPKKRARVESD